MSLRSHIPIRLDSLTFLFFLLLSLIVSRGILELMAGKKMAMLGQFTVLIGISTFMFARFRLHPSQKATFTLALLFTTVSLLSGMMTFAKKESLIWMAYVMFNCGLLWLALLTLKKFERKELSHSIAFVILVIGWVLVVVAFLEQIHVIRMKGSGHLFVTRPASLTGSFLHYPIVIALMGFAMLQWYAITKKIAYLISGILFCLSPFISASRSGALIILAALLVYPFFLPFRRSKRVFFMMGLFFMLIGTSFFLFSKESQSSLIHNFIYRVVSSTHTKSLGNNVRIAIWDRAFRKWLNTNLLLGEEAGEYTNSTNNLRARKNLNLSTSKVTESSPLQLMLNFGIFGTLLFYALLLQIPRYIAKEHFWMHAGIWGALAQTFVYQSIEVVPFITLLFLYPWISQCFLNESPKPRPLLA